MSGDLDWSTVVTRAEWGARTPRERVTIPVPVQYVIVHHSPMEVSPPDQQVRVIQNFHMDDRKWADIGYSFLVGEDAKIYEGRGWNIEGAHTYGYNKKGVGICVMGNFNTHLPRQATLDKLKSLIAFGVEHDYVQREYILIGHRDVRSTECPGQKLYEEIRTWSHYNAAHLN